MTYEQNYLERVNRLLAIVLALHVPVLPLVAMAHGNSALAALLATAAIVAAPSGLAWRAGRRWSTSVVIAASLMALSALTIAEANGRVEFHFHVFVSLALLTSLPGMLPLLVAAGAIAVQHVAAWLWAPASLLNYPAGFGDVLLHAAFVILETIPCCWIARQLGLAIRARSIVHEQLERNTAELAQGTAEVRQSNGQLASGAAEQAGSVAEVARSSAAIEQEVAGLIRAASEAELSASQLTAVVRETTVTLGGLVERMEAVTQANRRVGGIAKTIDTIAFQTNILALNAAVEAARAGEAGAGFAVVADEVRTLAQNAAAAARDAEQTLSESLEHGQASAAGVADLRQSIGQLSQTAAAFQLLIERLRTAAAGQQEGVNHMAQRLRGLSSAAEAAAQAVERSTAANARLGEVSSGLAATVAELKALG